MNNEIVIKGNRKKNKRKIKVLKWLFLLFVVVMCIFCIVINYLNKHDYINLNKSEIKLYINAADEVSKGKLQINWKFLAAIDGVRYKEDFSKSNDNNLKQLGQMFLEKNSTSSKKNKYKLISLENVLNKVSFSDKQKKKVYKYLTQLETIGLAKNNLAKGSSYRNFIEELSPKAVELYNKYGILPSITISQAIMESGWGKSDLSVKANNLFGIKADRKWKGQSANMITSEYYDDVIKANFRKYKNKIDSMDDYGKFLSSNERYRKNGFFDASGYIEQAQAIENAGYGTKKNKNGNSVYADLLIKIIKENDLQLIDNRVQGQK